VQGGVDALELQLSSKILSGPYNTVPRQSALDGLRALTQLIALGAKQHAGIRKDGPKAALRILRCLLTGVGVRKHSDGKLVPGDIYKLLNTLSNIGSMDIAQQVVTLQDTTRGAPRLSVVTYSILLKGYGRLHDIKNVRSALAHSAKRGIVPDTVMVNSALDAFVNCDETDAAREVFRYIAGATSKYPQALPPRFFQQAKVCSPDELSYNTMMKAFAKTGALDEAIELASRMRERKYWDCISTNMLVSAAVNAKEFDFAESVLANHTETWVPDQRSTQHPNVEAYSHLLDGYAKSGDLEKALGVMKVMSRRQVPPIDPTYTAMMSALAKSGRVSAAIQLLDHMTSKGVRPTVITFNALMSGIVDGQVTPRSFELGEESVKPQDNRLNDSVEHVVEMLRRMINMGIRPDETTVAIMVDALGKCSPPRISEAITFVSDFEKQRIISRHSPKVNTALVHAYGVARDREGARSSFLDIKNPDAVAVNAYMNALSRCGDGEMMFWVFKTFFDRRSDSTTRSLDPTVVTYSILMNVLLANRSHGSMRKAELLYGDMKSRGIMPDRELVDW